jgi:hypothetical protein
MRALSAILACVGALAVVGCAAGRSRSGGSSVVLTVQMTPTFTHHTIEYTLRCDPTGGSMPHAAALCHLIAEYPKAMLFPGRVLSSCGAPFAQFTVTGTWHGRVVDNSVDGPGCDWPGGEGAFAYWAAIQRPGRLAVAARSVACTGETTLQSNPVSRTNAATCLDEAIASQSG